MDEKLADLLARMFQEANTALEKMSKDLNLMSVEMKEKMKMPNLEGGAVDKEYRLKKRVMRNAQVPWNDIVHGTGLASKPFNPNDNEHK